jgi:hypothetical protein
MIVIEEAVVVLLELGGPLAELWNEFTEREV